MFSADHIYNTEVRSVHERGGENKNLHFPSADATGSYKNTGTPPGPNFNYFPATCSWLTLRCARLVPQTPPPTAGLQLSSLASYTGARENGKCKTHVSRIVFVRKGNTPLFSAFSIDRQALLFPRPSHIRREECAGNNNVDETDDGATRFVVAPLSEKLIILLLCRSPFIATAAEAAICFIVRPGVLTNHDRTVEGSWCLHKLLERWSEPGRSRCISMRCIF